jgi:hypothetical protein
MCVGKVGAGGKAASLLAADGGTAVAGEGAAAEGADGGTAPPLDPACVSALSASVSAEATVSQPELRM